MNDSILKQTVYLSHHAAEFTNDELRSLMRHARKKNKRLGITGLLLVDRPLFLQVLEGPTSAVDSLIATIASDTRHRDMDIIYVNEQLPEREFAQWLMACKILGDKLPADYKALDERVKQILRVAQPNGYLAHRLLLDFRAIEDSFIDV